MLKHYLGSMPQIYRFILTGIVAVGTDFLSYNALISVLSIDIAKGSSFTLGAISAFFLNKLWTFNNQTTMGPTAIKFASLYSATFLTNIAVNHYSLILLTDIKPICFFFATGASTVLNYMGMKYWVFINNNKQQGCL
jgi:putative flippase GtrA